MRRSSRAGSEHRIERLAELRALSSPASGQVLDALKALGRGSVKEIAAHLGRPVESLYYHVRKLERVGLLLEVERRPTSRRSEAIYALVATTLRVDPARRTPAWLAESRRLVRARLRAMERDFAAGLAEAGLAREGPACALVARHARVRLGARGLAKVNAKLAELAAVLEAEHARDGGRVYSVLVALAPAARADGRRA